MLLQQDHPWNAQLLLHCSVQILDPSAKSNQTHQKQIWHWTILITCRLPPPSSPKLTYGLSRTTWISINLTSLKTELKFTCYLMKYPAQKEILCSLCKLSKLKLILISETFKNRGQQRTFPEKTWCKAMNIYEYFSKLQVFTSLLEKDIHCA